MHNGVPLQDCDGHWPSRWLPKLRSVAWVERLSRLGPALRLSPKKEISSTKQELSSTLDMSGCMLNLVSRRSVRASCPPLRAAFFPSRRFLASSVARRDNAASTPEQQRTPNPTAANPAAPFYAGPLARTFHSLKVFSLSSLALCLSVSPLMFIIDSGMASTARTGFVIFAVGSSSLSTALVGWLSKPYVLSMSRLGSPHPEGAVELLTKNVLLQDRRTKVYDPMFLGPTKRPFAKWELLDQVVLDQRSGGTTPRRSGQVEVAAETFDAQGKVKGKWAYRWERQPGTESDDVLVGRATSQGKIVRFVSLS